MSRDSAYDLSYYRSEGLDPELRSPTVIVPLIVSLLHPKRVVDVGCGVGHWLSVFRKFGVNEILGVDGKHIRPEWLVIPKDAFRAVDLSHSFRLEENFDLAVCLEVGEHLPKDSADILVDSLVNLAPVVLFSAAVPMQGGTHHINEQWPDFWKELFGRHGYRRLDLIRKFVWKNPEVKFWYRQNTFLFVEENLVSSNPMFREAAQEADDLLLVHVSILRELFGLRATLKAMARATWCFLRRCSGMPLSDHINDPNRR